VSEEGKNLINSLLSSKDKRLCSKKYRENDQRGRRGSYRKPVGNTSGATFVFENDAEDIKRHPFFRNTDWDRLHLLPPPFVPRVAQDQPITKYFDDEKYILGTSDETGSTCTDDHNYTTDGPIEVSALMASLQNNPNSPLDAKKHEKALLWLMENNPHALKRLHKLKPKKRARDKILRDPHTSKTAMRVRKHGAFLGYTYRRADFPVICGDGRASARGSILPESSFTQSTPVAA
jgi:protein-serine/threonine kinase